MSTLSSIIITLLCLPWPAMLMMSPMMIASPNFADKKSSVIIALFFFTYPAYLFLVLQLLHLTFYGTSSIKWVIVAFILGSLASFIFRLPQQLLNLYRGIANYGYFILNNAVYFDGSKIRGADPASFIHYPNNSYYSKDANHVYRRTKKIPGADAATFAPLLNDETNNYWHDKNKAYYSWKEIIGADGASFEYIGHSYACDKNAVYWGNKRVAGADRASFKPLERFIGKDDAHVYILTKQYTNNVDLATFEVVKSDNELFCKDKNKCYLIRYKPEIGLEAFPDADVETLEILDSFYAKDKKHVYYYNDPNEIILIKDANPATFSVQFDGEYRTDAVDGANLYKAGKLFHPANKL